MKLHPRINPANKSLLRELPIDHPAVRALQIHAEARDICVGKEIDWPHLGIVGIDQKWSSDVESREMRFSGFAYQYISYDLFLDGWVESDPEGTETETRFLERSPRMRTLLDECEAAARVEDNVHMLPLISKARGFVDALEEAILYRLKNLRQENSESKDSLQQSPAERSLPLGFHSRINRVNYSLLRELPADHPAVRALQIHAEAYDICSSEEICRPHQATVGIDQIWFSDVDLRQHRFSSFADDYICYDLVLDGWVESAPEATEAELGFLEDAPKMRALLKECEQAAHAEENVGILPLVAKANEFIDALEHAIRLRLRSIEISGVTGQWISTIDVQENKCPDEDCGENEGKTGSENGHRLIWGRATAS